MCMNVFRFRHSIVGGTSIRFQESVSEATEVPGKTAVEKPGADPANA